MRTLDRKAFSLGDLKFGWLLIISLLANAATFYADRHYDPDDQFWLSVFYGLSFALAVLWGAVNYIGHIRLNVMYRKHHDIHAYVEQLAMDEEDRLELQNYLEDYAQDLIAQGKTPEEAAGEAISQFKVKEIVSLSKNSPLFDLPGHYYLLGWTVLAVIAFVVLGALEAFFFPSSLPLLIAETILAAYGAGLAGMFFVYRLLDALIYRKLDEHLS